MNQDELAIYLAVTNFATENLFWQLVYLNNAVFQTPLKIEAKEKLLGMKKMCGTIISSFYPSGEGGELVEAMAKNNRLFVAYADSVMQGSSRSGILKRQWRENGQQIAHLLCRMNPYWRTAEWTAMINHEADLLDKIATSLHARNYTVFVDIAPICRRLAIDMSNYMSSGLAKQLRCTTP